MQNTTALYRKILADPNHWFETSVVIGDSGNLITERGETILFGGFAIRVAASGADDGFGENIVLSVSTTSQLFSNDPEIGKAVSAEIDLKMLNPSGDIPRMGVVIPYVRVCKEDEQSEWLQQGVFYIDTREISDNDNDLDVITIHGYDAMMKAEQDYASTSLNWPAVDTDIVSEIAGEMGVSVDPRTWEIMTDGYTFPLPTNYTLREMLGYIASMYVGCFIMTETGRLRLVTLLELPKETNHLIDSVGDAITFGGERILV